MSQDRRYHSPAWRTVRRAVLARDKYVCQIRLPKCRGFATDVDHIVEVSRGGSFYSLANLQSACRACNTAKRNRNLAADAKRQRGTR